VPGNANAMLPSVWTEEGLTRNHVPLLFYAPGRLKPQRINRVCSQVDVLPTIAGIAGIPYVNHALGRDLFDSSVIRQPGAYIVNNDLRYHGFIRQDGFYYKYEKTNKEKFFPFAPAPSLTSNGSSLDSLRRFSDGWYESAKFLLFNNKKR
jgi:arylsulfatase A-like enzyme